MEDGYKPEWNKMKLFARRKTDRLDRVMRRAGETGCGLVGIFRLGYNEKDSGRNCRRWDVYFGRRNSNAKFQQ
ncbi:hypothetical protein SAMN04487771_10013 [[Clostridium] aminophilum]|uniref:Uncharacterized protein n=1 Tax=[Clostridium] aminophilum TaxID=1526 RepID=A0A1H9ZYH0_9FIRM|nr:hypothetical protein SAMN04487771_10013 [[Clostridium] aminophilum]